MSGAQVMERVESSDDLDALAASMDEAATQRVPSTNGSKMVPLAVSVDV